MFAHTRKALKHTCPLTLKIFVCIESYLPGTLGGGPVRALANLVGHLEGAHEFFIFTRNHDYLTAEPYAAIEPNTWSRQSNVSIYYSDGNQLDRSLLEQIKIVQPDWIYLNGALPPMTRKLLGVRRKVSALQDIPVLLAPHGNLSSAALAHHRFRKQAWLLYAKALGLYRGVSWHAASDRETEQIRAVFGKAAQIREVPMAPRFAQSETAPLASETVAMPSAISDQSSVINNQPSTISHQSSHPSPLKPQVSALSSPLRLVYFGRLSPEKNLPFAFELLKRFTAAHPEQAVVYDIIGSGELSYVTQLQELSEQLPTTVKINFLGQLTPEALQSRLNASSSLKPQVSSPSDLKSQASVSSGLKPQVSLPSLYHVMLMPSQTENFSYTVFESWQAGIPVLISDQTPWRGLEAKGLGWDLSLEDQSVWEAALQQLTEQTPAESFEQTQVIRKYSQQWVSEYPKKAAELFCLST